MPFSQIQFNGLLVPTNQTDTAIGLSMNELPIPLPTAAFTNRFIDSGLVEVPARIKSLVIVVTTAITSGAAQQATVQLFAARSKYGTLGTYSGSSTGTAPPSTPFAATQAGVSSFPTGTAPNSTQAIGVPVNFAGSVASIPTGVYWFTATWPGNPSASPPTSMTELAQEYPVLGIEITAPATFTAGLATAFFELAPL
jgi:hypothetical protein